MNRNAVVPVAMAFFLTVVAIAAVPGPVGALPAGGSAASAQDDPDEAPALVVVGDFNRDGVPDVARVTAAAGDLSGPRVLTVLLGHANGGFRQAASIPMPGHDPRSMVVGDFNGDGIPDLIVGDGDGSLIEFLGDGTGNMVPAGDVAHLGSIASIAVGDFNHDGILDIAVSDANLVTVLLGSGKGSFRAIWATPLPMQGAVFHIAVADFNGDGLPDLAITNEDQDTFEVLLGNGNGTFTDSPALSKVKDPNAHCPS